MSYILVAISGAVVVLMVSSVIVTSYSQGRQTYPRVHEEEYIEVRPGEKYDCPDCKMIFQDPFS